MAARYICPRCRYEKIFLGNPSYSVKQRNGKHVRWNGNGARPFTNTTRRAGTLKNEVPTTPDRPDGGAAITKGKKEKTVLEILEERGLVHNIAGTREGLNGLLRSKKIGAYVGIDPTAPSLHVGHLLPLMALFWMYLHGYPSVSLVGGFTARIGDPSGRTTARNTQSSSALISNTQRMIDQTSKLWVSFRRHAASHGHTKEGLVRVMNNSDWGQSLTLEQFLREIGSGVRLGTMLSRDTVKLRMEKGDGMSFAEFTYPLLQSYDFVRLYKNDDVQLQIGGSDQYGNIVAGVDAVKHYLEMLPESAEKNTDMKHSLNLPYGFTVPLLTTASGVKFGKSAENAIWLDPEKTTVFELYGFMLSTADTDVERYLRLFTLLSLDEITTAMETQNRAPSSRHAQHLLAHEFVSLVHGAEAATQARTQHMQLFSTRHRSSTAPSPSESSETETHQPFVLSSLTPDLALPRSSVMSQPFSHVLRLVDLVSSRSEGQRLLESGGVYLGRVMPSGLMFEKMSGGRTDVVREEDLVEGRLLLVRIGKKKVKVVEVVGDQEFTAREDKVVSVREATEKQEEKGNREGSHDR